MTPECNAPYLDLRMLGSRHVLADLDGGDLTSDGGARLLRRTEQLTGILHQSAACSTDHRNPELIEHTAEELVAQPVYALALGYEGLNDHDELRRDPLLAAVVGRADPTGRARDRRRDRGKARAGKSTPNRLEPTPVAADADSRDKRITCDTHAVERMLVPWSLQAHDQPPERIVPDLDAAGDPIHGHQLGRSFHGYCKDSCYLPLYLFCGDHLPNARLRPSDIDAAAGAAKQLKRVVARIPEEWPHVRITIRADSGLCRAAIRRWCEEDGVDSVIGPTQGTRLLASIAAELAEAKRRYEALRQPARAFADLRYQTRESWSHERRVVAKAEHLETGANRRFVVTSRSAKDRAACPPSEGDDCGRGAAEGRIKEQQLHPSADRTSARTRRANQIRLYFSSIASVLPEALRRLGLSGTELAEAQCQTIRPKPSKIGALVRVTVRKVWVSLARSCPYAAVFRRVPAHPAGLRPILLRC